MKRPCSTRRRRLKTMHFTSLQLRARPSNYSQYSTHTHTYRHIHTHTLSLYHTHIHTHTQNTRTQKHTVKHTNRQTKTHISLFMHKSRYKKVIAPPLLKSETESMQSELDFSGARAIAFVYCKRRSMPVNHKYQQKQQIKSPLSRSSQKTSAKNQPL